jgi:hypothetical protein
MFKQISRCKNGESWRKDLGQVFLIFANFMKAEVNRNIAEKQNHSSKKVTIFET